MPTYIAMLRGINVSGHKIIKMEALRASFAAMGFRDVKTYVQSGNVVFDAGREAAPTIAGKIEKRILRDFGFAVPVFLTTAEKMEETVRRNPFVKKPGIDQSKLHVTFLSGDPPKNAEESLKPLAMKPEEFRILGREIYLYCPNGYGTSKLSNTAIEKKLAVGATTRNWKTVSALLEMAR